MRVEEYSYDWAHRYAESCFLAAAISASVALNIEEFVVAVLVDPGYEVGTIVVGSEGTTGDMDGREVELPINLVVSSLLTIVRGGDSFCCRSMSDQLPLWYEMSGDQESTVSNYDNLILFS